MSYNHVATYDGHEFTRTSVNRTYTHCIVRVYEIAAERAREEQQTRIIWQINLEYRTKCARGDSPWVSPPDYCTDPAKFVTHHTDEERARIVAHWKDEHAKAVLYAQQLLAKTEEGTVLEDLEEFDRSMERVKKASDGLHYYNGGDEWTGRPELAEKAVRAWLKKGVTAIAVPATFTEG